MAVTAVPGFDPGGRLEAFEAFSAVMVADHTDRVVLQRILVVEATSTVVAEDVEAGHNLVLVLVLALALADLCPRRGYLSHQTDSTLLLSVLEVRGGRAVSSGEEEDAGGFVIRDSLTDLSSF